MFGLLVVTLMGSMSLVTIRNEDIEDDGINHDPDLEVPDEAEIAGDVIVAGVNSTLVEGSSQDDWIAAGRSCDTVDGGGGDDSLHGERGRDLLEGGDGEDSLDGGAWHDALDGGAGNDLLQGEAGMDTLDGGNGDDTLEGGKWHDLLIGGGGADVLQGGGGHDVLFGHVPAGPDGETAIGARAFHESLEATYDAAEAFIALSEAEKQAVAAELLTDMAEAHPAAEAGADGADSLYGGDGNDILYLTDDQDIGEGGAGGDSFVLQSWGSDVSADDTDAPRILDFGRGDDVIVIEYPMADGAPDPALSVDTLENGDQQVLADGVVLVTLIQPSVAAEVADIRLLAV